MRDDDGDDDARGPSILTGPGAPGVIGGLVGDVSAPWSAVYTAATSIGDTISSVDIVADGSSTLPYSVVMSNLSWNGQPIISRVGVGH